MAFLVSAVFHSNQIKSTTMATKKNKPKKKAVTKKKAPAKKAIAAKKTSPKKAAKKKTAKKPAPKKAAPKKAIAKKKGTAKSGVKSLTDVTVTYVLTRTGPLEFVCVTIGYTDVDLQADKHADDPNKFSTQEDKTYDANRKEEGLKVVVRAGGKKVAAGLYLLKKMAKT